MEQTPPPRISVIMATYNGARYIRQSLASLWAQSFRDFEVIVVDDCSTDDTPAVLRECADPRLVVVRNPHNLGVVESRNRCFARARGTYVAMLDHDDVSRPRRLELQAGYLDAHPDVVLVGTAAHTLCEGVVAPMRQPARTTPAMIAWLLDIANPLICSSIMFRAEVARRLPVLLREECRYADDYDFYHRMAPHGVIARLDEPLTIYRLHQSNTFQRNHETMTRSAIRVLAPVYEKWFGAEAEAAANVIVRYISDGATVPDTDSYRLLTRVFHEVTRYHLELAAGDTDTKAAIVGHAHMLWQRTVRLSAAGGGVDPAVLLEARPFGYAPDAGDKLRAALRYVPLARLRDTALATVRPQGKARPPAPPGRLFDTAYVPLPQDPEAPPTLWAVVDTESEFDWGKPFDRAATDVTAMDQVGRGQAVFDRYGLRPIYVIDYPIATQARAYGKLRDILERDGCAIGAHLHPWTTPPFDEDVSAHNSFPGNLPPALEAAKLEILVAAIRENLGVQPVIYRAGRYGFGPHTARTLQALGFKVDLSVLPGADLRRGQGPDFSALRPVPYRIEGTDLICLPMTRDGVGLVRSHRLANFCDSPVMQTLHIPAVLARLGLVETVTLTPEGVTAREQIALIRAGLARGQRHFVLHYHSPSLAPGHTPYVRTEADAQGFVARLNEVCRFFFQELGGMPGYPPDLLQL